MMKKIYILVCFASLFISSAYPQLVLMGDNAPFSNVNDGNFLAVTGYWRQAKQSPFWTTRPVKGDKPMGLHYGTLFSSNDIGIAESKLLNTNTRYQNPQAGDVWNWSFGADLEYISKGTISLSLVFGDREQILAEKVKLVGSDKTMEHFSGMYTLTEEDTRAGFPFVRVTFYSEQDVKVYLDYVKISVVIPGLVSPELKSSVQEKGILLDWTDQKSAEEKEYIVYRSRGEKFGYEKIGSSRKNSFLDQTLINGIEYTYVITRITPTDPVVSNKVLARKTDNEAPAPPTNIKSIISDTEIKLSWTKSTDNDVAFYSIYRGDTGDNNMRKIASGLTKNEYLDFTPLKDIENTYVVFAHDHSGNKSKASETVKAKVKAVLGASFSDLLLPMPVHKKLRSDVWGAEGVLPRDPDNGIEAPDWSYWGGRPVRDKDERYHMMVTRWPANATKGHWEWPLSTVAYVVADKPTGPYKVERDLAYDYHDGLGHNPDIILLNDGTYMLYSLIDWEATLFTSETMQGPWKRLGTMTVNTDGAEEIPERYYRFYRNLSGVHLEDGRFLFVSKAGAMMISQTENPLGPYNVLTKHLQHNSIIPENYRESNYEDPVLWKDEIQFHMMINAFHDYRAIYLRSPDGIHWKFNPGTAYTPDNTSYEDGTRTYWYKLERPHVLTDQYGRATHLSLAVIDVPKADDLARDKHSSKNLIVPLVVHKRIKMLNKTAVNKDTEKIKILLLSEPGFDAQKDTDIFSLRFGASEEVDFGRGCTAINTRNKGKDLIIEFDGRGNGLTENNFTCKLLGKTKNGELLIGFTKLQAE